MLRGRDYFENTYSDKGLMEEMAFQQGGGGCPSSYPSLASCPPWANCLNPLNNVCSVSIAKLLCRSSKYLSVWPCAVRGPVWEPWCLFWDPESHCEGEAQEAAFSRAPHSQLRRALGTLKLETSPDTQCEAHSRI